ncbi:putative leucine aminopeptidase 2 [Bisporella sp. PMI_857]|nr:putative leucine aminopeptidase 2 [Bisporella sp. PMI_857]
MKLSIAILGLLASSAVAAPKQKRTEPVQSNKLRRVLLRSNLLAKAQKLQDFAFATEERNRLIGGQGHNDTINWVADTLRATGYYDVTLQPFLTPSPKASTVTINGKVYKSWAMEESPEGDITGSIVAVPNNGCAVADYLDLTGKVALISRGVCTFNFKSTTAQAAGAVAVLIYNNQDGFLDSATLGSPGDYVPTVGILKTDGLALVSSLGTANVKIAYFDITTWNVLAQTKGGDPNNVLQLGAHSDSVEAGPGINDNGSGTVALLEIAQQLTAFTVKNAVRFSWWSAEEEGLLGAEAYVAALTPEENAKIRLYLNFDMIASPNFVYGIYDGDGSAFNISGAPGSGEVEKLFQDFYTYDEDIPWVPSEFNGRSDYGPFLDAGVPCGGLDTGADDIKTEEEAAIFGGTAGIQKDPNYHSAKDTVSNLNIGVLLHNSKAIAHAIATYGTSWAGFPARLPVEKRNVATKDVRRVKRRNYKKVTE